MTAPRLPHHRSPLHVGGTVRTVCCAEHYWQPVTPAATPRLAVVR